MFPIGKREHFGPEPVLSRAQAVESGLVLAFEAHLELLAWLQWRAGEVGLRAQFRLVGVGQSQGTRSLRWALQVPTLVGAVEWLGVRMESIMQEALRKAYD